MVHPYLRRREGKEKVEFPKPELEAVLGRRSGVPLFQEQAMNVAIVGAGFTPSEADALRRSMATFKSTGGVSHFQDKMIEGMVARGYTRDFAERTFKQIEGFGSYGFPESHAASFAKIAYASSWMKCHHPDVFCAAMLNAQPMGFYAARPDRPRRPATHGVEVRPVCINRSRWDCTLENPLPSQEGRGPGEAGGGVLAQASATYPSLPLRERELSPSASACAWSGASPTSMPRGSSPPAPKRPFDSVEDVWRRSGVPVAALEKLADADAFASLGLDRRQALWRVRGLGECAAAACSPPPTRARRASPRWPWRR